jgi:hypothetical protein
MMMLDTLVDRILADPLAPAKAAPRAMGYVGFDLPEDLLAGCGRFAVHLPWDADQPTPKADQWLERGFAPWARSILEQWAEGRFDFLDHVLFSRGEDNAQRLYYYISELQRRGRIGGPAPLILDVARIGRPASLARSIEAVRKVADQLGLTAHDLARGIEIADRRRTYFDRLEQSRSGPGQRYERIARAALFAPLEEADPGSAGAGDGTAAGRVLLAGTPPPDDRLHRAIEQSGWIVAGEAHDRSLARLGLPSASEEDPFVAIGRRAHETGFGSRSFADPAAGLVGAARRACADAVILWMIEEEESIVWHVPSQVAAMEQAGIPLLVLTRRRWTGDDGAPSEMVARLKEVRA